MFCRKTLIQELSKEEARRQPTAAEWLAEQDARARAAHTPVERLHAARATPESDAQPLQRRSPQL